LKSFQKRSRTRKKPEPLTPSVPQDTEDKKTESPAEDPLEKEQEVSNEIAKQEAKEEVIEATEIKEKSKEVN